VVPSAGGNGLVWISFFTSTSASLPSNMSFPSTGFFVVPVGVTRLRVKLWGAGGSGGGSNIDSTTMCYAGGSGGFTSGDIDVSSL
jgi:hypothetical protein